MSNPESNYGLQCLLRKSCEFPFSFVGGQSSAYAGLPELTKIAHRAPTFWGTRRGQLSKCNESLALGQLPS